MCKVREECGVFGVFSPTQRDVAADVYYGLFALQHRGQESCGIAVNEDGLFCSYKDEGLVGTVFTPDRLASLGTGNMAVGHVRYGTTGGGGRDNAQPIVVNHIKGRMALAHNGNLVNSYELRSELELQGAIFHTTSDTEVISYLITQERLRSDSIQQAVARAMRRLDGAYSLVIMSPAKLLAVRDPNGFRPLCYGQKPDGSYVVASESCALDSIGASFIRDVEPGEILVFSKNGVESMRDACGSREGSVCVFEYIYFARPDSVLDGRSVHACRRRAGEILAEELPVEADVVIGVPDSGMDAAIGYSERSGIPYEIGFIKNKYIGRTFISPGQSARTDGVKIKLNPISGVVHGKRVILVDDSIVRGTTSSRIVRLLRDAGATEVHLRVSAPPFLHPCYYGTDIDSSEGLIASRCTLEEVRSRIGVDTLAYLSIRNLPRMLGDQTEHRFCAACFSGQYPTAVPLQTQKNRFEQKISQKGEVGHEKQQ